ncbi:beta strand repeat-containing protein, partial [Cellulophaga sp. 2_MG-2023]|uniref:beta strand repeat-containing protein n=4 Tax=unclassified Cellulophaga TaxID=2634405 RepID=UPI0027008FA9|nr:hypothetical protein [Cellulophaga sp. 2_MG-2023]
MKINKLLLISFFAMAQYSFGQVKIGNDINTIDSASILELESTDKVLILTRVTNTQMNAITPLTGAMVYNTDEGCMFQYNGILWQSLCNTSSFNQTNTVIFDNNDGTFSYINENNITVVITKAQLSDNGDGTFSFVNGGGTSINFDGTDNQNLTTDGNPGSLTLENGGSVTINVNDADADDTNELNTDFSLNGTALEITDADGTLSQDLDATFVTEAELTTNNTTTTAAINAVQTDVDNNEAAASTAITALQNDKEDSANKSDAVTLGTSDDLFPTQNAVKTYVDNQVAGSAQVIVSTDADNNVTAGADGGAFYDDAALQTNIATNASNITTANTAITNVQDDVDANETAANTAIAAVQTDVDNNEAAANTAITLKEDSANKSDVVTLGTSDDLFPTQNAVKTYVDNQVAGSAQVIVSTDADNDVTAGTDGGAFYDDAALQTSIATNASNITAANTAITNVQNDVDANETAANTAIAAVQTDVDNNEAAANTAITALQNDKEDSANKSDVVTLGTSNDLFPTQNAVKTYVDNQVAGSTQVIVSTDADNDVTAGADGGAFYDDAALQTNIATNATNITAANTAITNVQNDVDANETAANTAIAAVQTDVDNNEADADAAITSANSAITALQNDKEDSANKSDVVTLGTSDDLFPTQNAVKTYVDNQVAASAQVIVSTDADNDVTAGADGGAFYDDAALQTSIATNASNITAETTRATNAENAIQADIDVNETAANTAIAAVQTDVDNNEAAASAAITALQNDKENSANKSDVVTLGTSNDLFPTQNAVKTYVDNQVAGSAQVIVSTDADNDVTAGADGGAFYDDAALQTSIATNATNITAANTAITNVQNDVDANETAANTAIAAVQTDVDNNEAAANTAIALKENSANKSDVVTLGTSDDLFPTQNAVKTYVDNQVAGSAQVIVSTDADNDVTAGADGGAFYDDAALQTSIATNATNITAANTAITNVQNDVDANETAANTAIAAVQTDVDNNEADADAAITTANTAITALQNNKENSANKSDVVTLGTSDDLFPTQNAVKTYVDNQVAGSTQIIVSTDADNDVTAGADGGAFYDDAALQTSIATNATNITAETTRATNAENAIQADVDANETAANTSITALQNDKEDSANKSDAVTLGTSDDLFPTQNAVKTYVDNQVAGSNQVIVSTDADNDVTAGADGGAFYDDATLQTNIATNATNITAETTRATNEENAIQADVDANETAANTAITALQNDKENSANKSDVVTLGTSDDLFPTQNAVKTYVDNQVAGSAQVIVSTDADNDVTAGADGGAFYDDAALQTSIATNATNITAANTAITDVQNDVDANETAANTAIAAVQTDVNNNESAANTAIALKEDSANKSDVVTLGTSDDLFPTQNAVKTYVDNQVAGSAQVIVSTDADNNVTAGADGGAFYDDAALQTSIATNTTNITAANTAITDVQNDVDANETAANTAIAAVQTDVNNNEAAANTAITTLQNDKEDSANKSDAVTLGTSDDLFPTQNAVKTYVDNQVAGSAQVIVSTDADNDVTAGADGGAFYDDAALQTNIATNATNITAANTAITDVQNDVDANETAANTAIAAVQTDVDNNEAAANTAITALQNDK